jgi:hypothetical protein
MISSGPSSPSPFDGDMRMEMSIFGDLPTRNPGGCGVLRKGKKGLGRAAEQGE